MDRAYFPEILGNNAQIVEKCRYFYRDCENNRGA
jgi:hypothetical protein